VPEGQGELARDQELASVAVGVALRRHAGRARVVLGPDGRVVERTGRDLRETGLLAGRHPHAAYRLLQRLVR
jgi:hypothetical protein